MNPHNLNFNFSHTCFVHFFCLFRRSAVGVRAGSQRKRSSWESEEAIELGVQLIGVQLIGATQFSKTSPFNYVQLKVLNYSLPFNIRREMGITPPRMTHRWPPDKRLGASRNRPIALAEAKPKYTGDISLLKGDINGDASRGFAPAGEAGFGWNERTKNDQKLQTAEKSRG